jgi:beta-glucanase (GH16 family)
MEIPEGTAAVEPRRRDVLRLMLKGGVVIGAAALAVACGDGNQAPSTETTPRTTAASQPEVAAPGGEFSPEASWSQDFSRMPNGSIDEQVWRHELAPEVPGYNNEAQGYTKSLKNVRIEDGSLVLEAHREPYTYPNDPEQRTFGFTSGRIDTLGNLDFEFGKLEAKIKLPKGTGTWPAFWLLSANQVHTNALNPTNQDWGEKRFYMHDGEVDIMEAYGSMPGVVEATVHTFAQSPEDQINVPDASETFHTYGIEITPTKLTWTINGRPYYTFEKPSDNPDQWPFGNGNRLYAILNLAMGSAGGEIDPKEDSWRMEVGAVNFYEYQPQ